MSGEGNKEEQTETESEGNNSDQASIEEEEEAAAEVEQEQNDKPTFLSLSGAMTIGSRLQYLQLANACELPVTIHGSDKLFIHEALVDLENSLADIQLDSSILVDVSRQRRQIEDDYFSDENGEGNDEEESRVVTLSDSDGERLANLAESWNGIIAEELENETRLPIYSKGIIDLETAARRPSQLFHDNSTWESLPDHIRSDIAESCLAVATGCPTASVFLSLRCVEERLGEWYTVETGRSIENRTFGQVLSELTDFYDEDSRPPLLSHMDYLKDRRNDVAHPEGSPNLQEAVSTLIMVRETISNIQDFLNEPDGIDQE